MTNDFHQRCVLCDIVPDARQLFQCPNKHVMCIMCGLKSGRTCKVNYIPAFQPKCNLISNCSSTARPRRHDRDQQPNEPNSGRWIGCECQSVSTHPKWLSMGFPNISRSARARQRMQIPTIHVHRKRIQSLEVSILIRHSLKTKPITQFNV